MPTFEDITKPQEDLKLSDFIQTDPVGTGNPETNYYLAQRMSLLTNDTEKYVQDVHATANLLSSLTTPEVTTAVKSTVDSTLARLQGNRLDLFSMDIASQEPTSTPQQAAAAVAAKPEGSTWEQLVETQIEDLKGRPLNSLEREAARQDALKGQLYMYMLNHNIDPEPNKWDYLGAMVPFRNVYNQGLGNKLEQTSQWFHQLKEEDQLKQFVNVLDDAFKNTDNAVLRAQDLAPFINYADIAEVKKAIAFDAFDIATSVPFLKILKELKFSQTPIQLLKDVGQTDKAAKLAEAAMRSEDAARAAGTTMEDASISSSPFSSSGIDPRLVEGLSPEVQKIIAEGQAKTSELLRPLHDDTILSRRAWTAEEVAASMQKWLTTFAGKARVLRTDTDGVLYGVDIVRTHDVTSVNHISERIDELAAQLEKQTEAHLNVKRLGPDSFPKSTLDEIRNNILSTKKELANLKAIRNLDNDINSATVELTIANANNPEAALSKVVKDLTSKLIKMKSSRARLVERLQTRTIETPDIEQRYIKFTEDDFGNLKATELAPDKFAHVNSPSVYMHELQPGAVATARNIGFTVEQIKGIFQKAYSESLRKISFAQRRDLDKILLQGDEDKIVYSAADLVNGVRTKHGLLKLDTAEAVDSYYRIRRMSDDMYAIKNQELVRKLELQNYKALQAGDNVLFAKPKYAMTQVPAGVKRIFNVATGQVEDVRALSEIEKVYRLRKPLIRGDEEVTHAIARDTDFKDIPTRVLDYRPGYVPKIRKGIYYVGELIGPRTVDGVKVANTRKVVRFFDNPADVEAWKKHMAGQSATVDVRSTAQWFEENPTTLDEWEEMMFGGTYEGSRTDGEIPLNLTMSGVDRMGALESLEAYMNHLSSRMPAVDFRLALVRRFENSAKDPITGESWLNKSRDWRDPLNLDKTNPNYSGMKAAQDWTKAQLGIKTTEERIWDKVAYDVSRMATNIPLFGTKASKLALKAGTADITGLMRTAAFHATLGWFSPAQFVVQAMGFSTALALDPLGAPINLGKYLAMRAALIPGLGFKDALVVRRAAEAAGEDVGEFTQMVAAYKRTGLHESVKSSGDYGLATSLHPTRAGISAVADKGLMFFRAGEQFVRGYAWVQAWRKLYKTGTKVTDAFIDQVTNESMRYTLDLNRANKAYWQTGVLSIPTQFMQITTKFAENLLYKGERLEAGWDRWEKTKVALGSLVLFGAAGVPAGNWALNSALEYLKGDGEYGLGIKDKELLTLYSGGMAEWAMFHMTGQAPAFSQRVSIPYGIEQFFDRLSDQNASTLEIAAGVFGEVPKRAVQALGHMVPMYAAVLHEPATYDTNVALETANDLATLLSSYSNVRKAAIWWKNEALMTNKGDKIARLEGNEKIVTVLSKALGISPKEIGQYGDIKKYNTESDKMIRESVDKWVEIARRYSGSDVMNTPEGQKRVAFMIEFAVSDLTREQRVKVAEQVSRRLADNDYALSKELLKFIENAMDRHGDIGNLESNTLLLPSPSEEKDINAQ